MAKKATRKSPGKKKTKSKKAKTTDALKERAHKVWLAGLGALAVAEEEGGKLFGQLVDKGAALEKRGKPTVDKMVKKATDAAEGVRKKAETRAGKIGDEAKDTWSKVESAVDEKVTAALHRMGIPTRKEIEELSKRVETLTEKLDEKGGRKPARKKSTRKPAKKKATKKKATKKRAKKASRKPAKKSAKKATRKPSKKTTRKPAKKAASASSPASADTSA